eukprot:366501-Chlamydomonas_euryale.AAC.6
MQRAEIRVAQYVRTCGLRRTVHTNAQRVQYVLYAQVKRCGCCRWCCGFRNTAFAPHGVDFTQWIVRLCNKRVPQRHVGVLGHEPDVHMCKESSPAPA